MARDGWVLFVFLGLAAALCAAISYISFSTVWTALACVLAAMALFTAFFFRDPARSIPKGEDLVLSGGDGRVMAVKEIENEPFIGGAAKQISVFLSITNVHINRIPITGVVKLRKRLEGPSRLAFRHESSNDNAQVVLGIKGDRGRVVIKQIVGFVARRVVCNVEEGDAVRGGDRFGLIRFGSRIDVLVPSSAEVRVHKGDRVRGGETILGVLR